jgi:hypothetical protein
LHVKYDIQLPDVSILNFRKIYSEFDAMILQIHDSKYAKILQFIMLFAVVVIAVSITIIFPILLLNNTRSKQQIILVH